MTTVNHTTVSNESPPETVSGMAISLAFWLCLVLSAALFAVVALSPKFLVYLQLRGQFDANQVRLVSLETQAERLQRVIDAIRNDKDFASELTRIEFDAVRPDEEVIPVDSTLELDNRALAVPESAMEPARKWYAPIVQFVANDRNTRVTLLGSAAILIVISFTILQPAGAEQVTTGVHRANSIWRSLLSRYLRQA